MPQDNSRQKQMTTYIWCSQHDKLFNKELGCSSCDAQLFTTHEPNETTIAAMEEALNER